MPVLNHDTQVSYTYTLSAIKILEIYLWLPNIRNISTLDHRGHCLFHYFAFLCHLCPVNTRFWRTYTSLSNTGLLTAAAQKQSVVSLFLLWACALTDKNWSRGCQRLFLGPQDVRRKRRNENEWWETKTD